MVPTVCADRQPWHSSVSVIWHLWQMKAYNVLMAWRQRWDIHRNVCAYCMINPINIKIRKLTLAPVDPGVPGVPGAPCNEDKQR